MSPDFHAHASEILASALELPEHEREDYVTRACGQDLHLRAEVLSLLQHSAPELLSPPATPLEPTSTLGGMKLEAILHQSLLSTVFEAERETEPRRVAVKVLHVGGLDGVLQKRFLREAESMRQLEHPGIARLFDAGSEPSPTGPRLYLVMERVDGEPLDEFLRQRTLGIAEKLRLFEEIASAVDHAHSRGVVHRDLKPSNILVREDGRPILVDFGVARLTGDPRAFTLPGQLLGTVPYMSPEQAIGDADIGPAADLYSLGLLLCEILTGRLPFEVADLPLLEALRVIREDAPTDPRRLDPSIDPTLRQVILRCLAKEPENRYPSAKDLLADLRRFQRGEALAHESSRRPLFKIAVGATLISATTVLAATRPWQDSAHGEEPPRTTAGAAEEDESLQRIRRLQDQQKGLWPRRPFMRQAFYAWMTEAEELLAQAENYQRELDLLEQGPAPQFTPEIRHYDVVRDVVIELNHLRDAAREVRGRLEVLDAMEAATIIEPRERWQEVRRTLAEDERFADLLLPPQLGLVPLRQDPESRLWEFLHWESGVAPEVDENGRYLIGDDIGVILVLLPGDPSANLPPYFLGKYEIHQSQWVRIAGNPSRFHRGTSPQGREGRPEPYVHPVENLDGELARMTLSRWGLTLPTVQQWEHAERAGRSAESIPPATPSRVEETWWMSAGVHGPVDAFPPNPWGLCALQQNVSEWCRDRTDPEQTRPRVERPTRGGNFEALRDATHFAQDLVSQCNGGIACRAGDPFRRRVIVRNEREQPLEIGRSETRSVPEITPIGPKTIPVWFRVGFA